MLRDALAADVPYAPFDGIVLTDTFQMHEAGDLDDGSVFRANGDRVIAQRSLDIRVIIGNPPYSVGQTSGNDNAANLKYPTLDAKIESTYAARSAATNKNSLYDSYIRAIRWASDRIGDNGVIGFVTNGGFIDSNTADGLRLSLADEFATIYVYNLRGNQRTAGELSRREGGKVFGGGSRNTVAVTFLVKHPSSSRPAALRYRDIGDYLSREDKLRILDESTINSLAWQTITPNDDGDWLNQRSDAFDAYEPIGEKDRTAVFAAFGRGLETGRDPWVYNFSRSTVASNVASMVSFYNNQATAFSALLKREGLHDPKAHVESFISTDPTRVSWTRSLRQALARGEQLDFDEANVVRSAYRPFCLQSVYFDRLVNHERGKTPSIFPRGVSNVGFTLTGAGSHFEFCLIATDALPNLHLLDTGQFFARWTYETAEGDHVSQGAFNFDDADVVDGYKRIDNITDAALKQYRSWYGAEVAKDDIFAFVYGFLHSPDYRTRFAADLKRSLPRIPRIQADDFAAFRDAGSQLLGLHIGYADVDPYPLTITGDQPSGPGLADRFGWFRVEKIRWAGKGKDVDKSGIAYNPRITIAGIPDTAHRYMLGPRSALEWILDRYQVKTDAASGIVNDPNDWSREVDNPRYILDLIAKVTTVSVETMRIVDGLPPLRIVENTSATPTERKV
jgi:predicted helicase